MKPTYDTKPFQERFHQLRDQGVSVSEMARRADMWRNHVACPGRTGDGVRLKRAIGLARDRNGIRQHVRHDMAARLAAALDIDPVDLGL